MPGMLVMRPMPIVFPMEREPGSGPAALAATHDGPYMLLSTCNPAPAHLLAAARTSTGTPPRAAAPQLQRQLQRLSWAQIALPPGSRAESWYPHGQLLPYTGLLAASQLAVRAAPDRSGRYVMVRLRGDRPTPSRRGGAAGELEYRVAWRGWPCEDDTWEPEHKLHSVDPGLIANYRLRKQRWRRRGAGRGDGGSIDIKAS